MEENVFKTPFLQSKYKEKSEREQRRGVEKYEAFSLKTGVSPGESDKKKGKNERNTEKEGGKNGCRS